MADFLLMNWIRILIFLILDSQSAQTQYSFMFCVFCFKHETLTELKGRSLVTTVNRLLIKLCVRLRQSVPVTQELQQTAVKSFSTAWEKNKHEVCHFMSDGFELVRAACSTVCSLVSLSAHVVTHAEVAISTYDFVQGQKKMINKKQIHLSNCKRFCYGNSPHTTLLSAPHHFLPARIRIYRRHCRFPHCMFWTFYWWRVFSHITFSLKEIVPLYPKEH